MNSHCKWTGRLASVISACILPLWANAAQAQDRDHIVLGAGVAVVPAYQGSDDYRVLPLPAIDIKEGMFFANLRNGIGIAPIDTEAVTVGASAVFIQGYRRRDVPDGIDKLSDALGARLFATVHSGGFLATLGATKAVSGGTKGVIVDATVAYPISMSPRFSLMPAIGATWANARHNDGYFGVTAAESVSSGLPQFSAGAGFKDVSAFLTAAYRLTDHVTLSATGSLTTLLGDAKDSPTTFKKTQPAGLLTASYRF